MYVCAVKDLRRRRYDVEDDGGQMGVRELGTGFSSLGVQYRLVSGFVLFFSNRMRRGGMAVDG